MIDMIWIWLAVVAVSLIIEFISMDLTSIWFSIAGLISLILSAIPGVSWVAQLIVFIILSAVLLIFVRKITKKMLVRGGDKNAKTNLDAIIGKRKKLLSAITKDAKGTLSVNDIIWNVVSEDGEEIGEGEVVEITEVAGNKLIVRKVKGALENAGNEEPESEKAEVPKLDDDYIEKVNDKKKNVKEKSKSAEEEIDFTEENETK